MKQNGIERPVRVGLISLGCAKNLADAEIMLGTLLKDGIEITNDASQADVVIVNTCSFIDSAPEEERERISKTHSETDEPSRTTALLSTPLVEVNSRPTYIPDYATPRFRL